MISPFSLNKYFAEKCNELFIVGIDFKLEEYQADTWSHAFVIVSWWKPYNKKKSRGLLENLARI